MRYTQVIYKAKFQNHATRTANSLKEIRQIVKELMKRTGMHPNDFKGIQRDTEDLVTGKITTKYF